MTAITLTPVPVPFNDDSIKVSRVQWSDSEPLRIEVVSMRSGRTCTVEFELVTGLRVLHELDLASAWINTAPEILQSTWLFKVGAGGWLDLECTRNDFYTQHEKDQPHEFLVGGYQECVSVLSLSFPQIVERT